MTDRITLDGQAVVITGAGQGLGRAYALELAGRGAKVVVNDVDAEAADAVVDEISNGNGTAVASTDSVATPEGGAAIIDRAVEAFGTVDAVVHNAGVWRHAPFEEMTADLLDPVLDVHLRGAFFVARPAWTLMKDNGYGRIVLTSSGAGAFGREFGANYAAAKAGILGLGRALALEGDEHGIRTNCILPIAPFVQQGRPRPAEPPSPWQKEMAKKLMATGITPAATGPELVAPMVAYLVSPQCEVNGEAFSAGGGRFARVFTGVTAGWTTPDDTPATAEQVVDAIDQVEALDDVTVPDSVWDELRGLDPS